MTFKQNWEKSKLPFTLSSEDVMGMIKYVFPTHSLVSEKMISGGCANLNIKIKLKGIKKPFILRIYLRDKEAAFREQKLGILLEKCLPLPLIRHIGDYKGYRFAFAEFIEGLSLRELLLSKRPHDISSLMYNVGLLLTKIRAHHFSKAGFLDNNLKVQEILSQESYLLFIQSCLKEEKFVSFLSSPLISQINYYMKKYEHFFPTSQEKNLVHGDFDPSNIFVKKEDHTWQISGVLDWEFAFSGSTLWDVANIMRYAHHMPPSYEEAFCAGLREGGYTLPENWHLTISLMNILSLLSCLKRSDPQTSPNQCKDSLSLIHFCLTQINANTP